MQSYGTSPLELMAADAMLKGLVYLDQFTYSATWSAATNTVLTANGTIPVQVQINGDADFVCQAMNIAAYNAVGTAITPDYLLELKRAGSGREVMSQFQHVTNICGNNWNNAQSGMLPLPGLIQMANTLTLTLQNRTATAANFVQISMIGFKVFYQKAGNRMNVFHAL